jgi:uronate dehydrogenase
MRVLITGAAGRIGRKLRHEFQGRFDRLVLFDRLPITDLKESEIQFCGELTDKALLLQALDGVDAVVHLASIPHEAPMEDISQNNVMGTWTVYELAHSAGVKRVVHGSSNHAVGFYPRSEIINESARVRPDTRYGLSKCWGEAVGQYYADKHGLKSLHIRIGNAADRPEHERSLALWISGRDLAQLVMIGIEHPAIDNTIVYGISRNARAFYDNGVAEQLGYQPMDSADDYATDILQRTGQSKEPSNENPVAQYYQGGHFCTLEFSNPETMARLKKQS